MTTRKQAYEAITDHIVMLLKREPLWSADELADACGFSTPVVRVRLRVMEEFGTAYRVKIEGKGGIRHYWQYGPKPSSMKLVNADARKKYLASLPEPREIHSSVNYPKQSTVTSWKPLAIRNEFETYLFGPACKEAA